MGEEDQRQEEEEQKEEVGAGSQGEGFMVLGPRKPDKLDFMKI